MNNNRVDVDDESDTINPNTMQSETLPEHSPRRKLLWIILSIIVVIFIVIISIVILIGKKTESGNTSTTEALTTKTTTTTTKAQTLRPSVVNINTKWKQVAVTVAGGNRPGDELNQLHFPLSIYVDDDEQSIYTADYGNHRVVKWKFGAEEGEIVAGVNEKGNKIDQLNKPTDAILDKRNNYLVICDSNNRRVVRWSRDNAMKQQIMISDIDCWGLTMDNRGDLYVSDHEKNEVRCWKQGEPHGTIVAGRDELENHPNQLGSLRYFFIDEDYSVYVADFFNARVMKWIRNATQGVVVARAHVSVENPDYPDRVLGVIGDHTGNIYVSDTTNCQVARWAPDTIKGSSIVGGLGCGMDSHRLFFPSDLSFDRQGNLYIADTGNHRIQKFSVDRD